MTELISSCSSSPAPVKEVVFHQEVATEERDQESKIRAICKEKGVSVKTFWGASLFHK